MRKIRHGKLPITLESSDELSFEMLEAISLNMEHDKKNHYSGWEYWVDEYGQWFNPYKPNPNQLQIPFPELKHFADDFHEGK